MQSDPKTAGEEWPGQTAYRKAVKNGDELRCSLCGAIILGYASPCSRDKCPARQSRVSIIPLGARVRLLPQYAESWILPERKFAQEGRLATVVGCPCPGRGIRDYRIEFDVKRKGARPVQSMVRLLDLEIVNYGE